MLTLETMKTLYFDCFSGISGDMTIGALLDLGLEFEYLKAELKKLPVEGYELRMSRVVRSNLSAMKFDVLMEGEHGHDHQHHHGVGHFHRGAPAACHDLSEACTDGTCHADRRCDPGWRREPVRKPDWIYCGANWVRGRNQAVSGFFKLPAFDGGRGTLSVRSCRLGRSHRD